jgi:hypothetical protein
MSSFKIRDMSILSYAQGFSHWHYNSKGATLAEVTSDGFFDPLKNMLKICDVITITNLDTGHVTMVSVFTNDGNTVTTTKLV